MAIKYNSPSTEGATKFNKSPMADVQFSRMTAIPTHYTTFNGGDIVPLYYSEILPHDTFKIDVDFVTRLTTSLRPTMGDLFMDIYAFFVPNRIINESWKNVQGENSSGYWTAPEVDLAPLYVPRKGSTDNITSIRFPVGSVADYYGFPTQAAIPVEHLTQMNDLKFRGYLDIYNNYFRDQNYQPPIPFSKLNVYNGFLNSVGSLIGLDPSDRVGGNLTVIDSSNVSDGSFAKGAVVKSLYGAGGSTTNEFDLGPRMSTWNCLQKPLKANKLHDAFTSVLPAPQKGPDVYFGIGNVAPVSIGARSDGKLTSLGGTLHLGNSESPEGIVGRLWTLGNGYVISETDTDMSPQGFQTSIKYSNLQGYADLSTATGVSVNDLRTAIATQQVYEILARGGSRYSSVLASMFEVETASPFMDIPLELGHIRRKLDMYQVAQTSASVEGESAQGSLTAFGYTNNGGSLVNRTFIEHGYIHIFGVVRQKNVYSTYLAPDNFRMSALDFYLPPLANIGEQPVLLRTLNPFRAPTDNDVLGYQEAWWEYRNEPDRVSGEFRTGINGSQDIWHYGDDYDATFTHVNGEWLKSNAEEVINRTIAVTSELAHQFKGAFVFKVDKQRPMPTFSVPGLDTI